MSTIANPTTHVFALSGVGNLIPQSIAGYIEDMAQESDTVRVKEIGTDVGIPAYAPSMVTGGKSFDADKATPLVKKAIDTAPVAAQKLMEWKLATLARVANH